MTSIARHIAPAPPPGARIGRFVAVRHFRDLKTFDRAEFCDHFDLADHGLRQHAGKTPQGRRARQRDITEFLVFKGKLGPLDLHVRAQPRQTLGEMTPVGPLKRAFAVVRAGRRGMRAASDQLFSQGDDPRIARRRTRLGHQQRVARPGPKLLCVARQKLLP